MPFGINGGAQDQKTYYKLTEGDRVFNIMCPTLKQLGLLPIWAIDPRLWEENKGVSLTDDSSPFSRGGNTAAELWENTPAYRVHFSNPTHMVLELLRIAGVNLD